MWQKVAARARERRERRAARIRRRSALNDVIAAEETEQRDHERSVIEGAAHRKKVRRVEIYHEPSIVRRVPDIGVNTDGTPFDVASYSFGTWGPVPSFVRRFESLSTGEAGSFFTTDWADELGMGGVVDHVSSDPQDNIIELTARARGVFTHARLTLRDNSVLLYIGVTVSPKQRFKAHQRVRPGQKMALITLCVVANADVKSIPFVANARGLCLFYETKVLDSLRAMNVNTVNIDDGGGGSVGRKRRTTCSLYALLTFQA